MYKIQRDNPGFAACRPYALYYTLFRFALSERSTSLPNIVQLRGANTECEYKNTSTAMGQVPSNSPTRSLRSSALLAPVRPPERLRQQTDRSTAVSTPYPHSLALFSQPHASTPDPGLPPLIKGGLEAVCNVFVLSIRELKPQDRGHGLIRVSLGETVSRVSFFNRSGPSLSFSLLNNTLQTETQKHDFKSSTGECN